MKTAFIAFVLFLLVGCGSGPAVAPNSDNHGYGFEFDTQGATGLKLRHSGLLHPDVKTPDYFESAFAGAMQCFGITAPPPFVIVVPSGSLGPGVSGLYHRNPSLILVDAVEFTIFRHEVIHYLLDVNTGDLDPGHKSPLFQNGVDYCPNRLTRV